MQQYQIKHKKQITQLQKSARKMKSHTITESVISLTCSAIVKTMIGEEYKKEILKIPLSNNTISQRVKDSSENI